MNFWEDLPKPFFALAPMEDVTDVVFRQVVARAAKPDVFFTEFMNVSGFCHPMGRNSVARRLETAETDAPIVAQIWGKDPEQFAQTAAEIAQMNQFVGIDINMGCPVKDVVKTGGGSALIQNPALAVELIQAAKEGCQAGRNNLLSDSTPSDDKTYIPDGTDRFVSERDGSACCPVNDVLATDGSDKKLFLPNAPQISVKTRLGFSSLDEWHPWLTTLLEQNLSNLTVHLRTRKEMSKVPAHFEMIPEIVKLRDQIAPQTKLTINGDIRDRAHGMEIWRDNPGLDGFMIGRGVFANPFCFEKTPHEHGKEELLDLLKYHLDLFDQYNKDASFAGLSGESSDNSFKLDSPNKSANEEVGSFVSNRTIHKFDPLKRFFKIYARDFDGASELRAKLMETKSTDEVRQILSGLNY